MIEPAFEIRYGKDLSNRIEIYADGMVTGLGGLIARTEPLVIVNRIPQLLAEAYSSGVHRD